ncbi:precorrin-2 dehydrogenase/sirohydrochlorin ferrochelatase family protein [Caldiplasma sukawensis]
MIVDLKLNENTTLFIGRGGEFTMKVDAFRKESKRFLMISDDPLFSEDPSLLSSDLGSFKKYIESERPYFTFVSTENESLDFEISHYAKKFSNLVYVPDRNNLSQVNLCAIIKRGKISIGISSQGYSPAMTVITKRKIMAALSSQKILDQEDVLMVDFISSNRSKIMRAVGDKRNRRLAMFRIATDPEIRLNLINGNEKSAMDNLERIIKNFSGLE